MIGSMGWGLVIAATAGIASMKAAVERGDLDEASRQGALAGVALVEEALASPDRATQLGAITAAPVVEGRPELLDALARIAGGPDRRTAIPAARAARTIARELAGKELADDLAPEGLYGWRMTFAALAADRTRWIDLRVLALDTASALANDGTGLPLDTSLADPDPALRRAAILDVAVPVPVGLRARLTKTIVGDTDPLVALAAGQVRCADLFADPPAPVLAALGEPGLARLRTAVATEDAPNIALREVARCLRADTSPASTAALRGIKNRVR
ncbi:hypothetical protein BH11MYX3_BH11MYX3_18190 [soil metagenome]